MDNLDTYAYRLARGIGYLSVDEVSFIKKIARILPAQATVVNIGAGSGTSIIAILEDRPDVEVWSVDISNTNGVSQFEEAKVIDRIAPLIGDSKAIDYPGPAIHLLFVDGGHLQDEIRGDIAAWIPRMDEHGIVMYHDYGSPHWPAVQSEVDAWAAASGAFPIGLSDTLIAFQVNRSVDE